MMYWIERRVCVCVCVCVCDARVQLVGPPTHACTPLGYGTPMLTRKSE